MISGINILIHFVSIRTRVGMVLSLFYKLNYLV
jgi:hypothetical protein